MHKKIYEFIKLRDVAVCELTFLHTIIFVFCFMEFTNCNNSVAKFQSGATIMGVHHCQLMQFENCHRVPLVDFATLGTDQKGFGPWCASAEKARVLQFGMWRDAGPHLRLVSHDAPSAICMRACSFSRWLLAVPIGEIRMPPPRLRSLACEVSLALPT